MDYYFSKRLKQVSFETALERTRQALQKAGFGVIAEIDFRKTLKEKIGADLRNYIVLEACSPQEAYQSVLAEENIGLLLPCNLLIQEKENGIEVSAINPQTMMQSLQNEELNSISVRVTEKLKQVVDQI